MKESKMHNQQISKQIIEAMNFRHACKEFNSQRIPDSELQVLIEAARLAPSSYGLEHIRLLVIKDENKKQELQKLCYNQKQVGTASVVAVFVADIGAIQCDGYIDHIVRRKAGKDEAQYAAYKQMVQNRINSVSKSELTEWSLKQGFLSAQSMMDAAAFLGIDSCPMEGFEKANTEKFLGLDGVNKQISIIVPFGYRASNTQPPKLRMDTKDFVEFI